MMIRDGSMICGLPFLYLVSQHHLENVTPTQPIIIKYLTVLIFQSVLIHQNYRQISKRYIESTAKIFCYIRVDFIQSEFNKVNVSVNMQICKKVFDKKFKFLRDYNHVSLRRLEWSLVSYRIQCPTRTCGPRDFLSILETPYPIGHELYAM